ncbi:MAG: NAD(P)/FAD-dependent oxidoreductase [Ruminococcaceae bacterium]|nr:NAD(P)/FAD-dependent oxidoreductase [Oscillospiraceae bacterium]
MAQIIVAGAGHGGLVAAIKLARLGYAVSVFEKSEKSNMGLPQQDVFDKDTFTYIDLPSPKNITICKNQLTLVPLDNSIKPLTLPQPEDEAIFMERKVLIKHLLNLAEKSGVKIHYNCPVIEPIILGSRVAGVKTVEGDFYGDVVIDACGVDSPLRNNLPKFMNINREIKDFDIIYTYRAHFEKNIGVPDPDTNYDIRVKEDGTIGFSWVVTEDEFVDILICRFSPLSQDEVLTELRKISEEYPHISKNFIRGGLFLKIPVCQPLGVLVADGYAAVGDSAFMTYPIKGSGISYAMKAGAILAEAISNDTNALYNTETLWEYQRRFFKEIGFTAGRLALMKNLMTYFTAQEINDIMKTGIFTTEDLSQIMTNKLDNLFGAAGRALIKDKIRQLRENTILKEKFSDFAVWMGKLAVTETYLPNKYDRKDVQKWVDRYNEFFDSIRKTI